VSGDAQVVGIRLGKFIGYGGAISDVYNLNFGILQFDILDKNDVCTVVKNVLYFTLLKKLVETFQCLKKCSNSNSRKQPMCCGNSWIHLSSTKVRGTTFIPVTKETVS
jgi:hypothetical protein